MSRSPAPYRRAMQRWEHRPVASSGEAAKWKWALPDGGTSASATQALDAWSQDGWELVAATTAEVSRKSWEVWFFKRPVA